ncbi:hypothetical protein EG68_02029 [Paragonimus skrjabini miyazakii]|uniref:Uncharacterized protein n=1 Tax=Paragonimus skrjabini miyazakii TaxID=59628 RepID=A0A8S9Z5B2_9TREM|nr:hypothetical protein EG68_02029 [Paragonimus skrjabini miyazakii]
MNFSLEELGRTASAQCAFRFDSNLSDTDWKKSLVSDFLNQLQDCLGPQLRSTLDRLLTEYHTAVDHVRERNECNVTESQKKYEAELERCQQSQLQEYQSKLNQVREELTSRIQAKEEELQKMQSKRDEWKETTSEKLRNKIEKQYKREFEQKCKEQFRSNELMHTSIECLANEQPLSTYATRAITELKARIQRLREENLSLRRLLLRRPLLSNKCEKTDDNAKAINVLAVAKSHIVPEFHSN